MVRAEMDMKRYTPLDHEYLYFFKPKPVDDLEIFNWCVQQFGDLPGRWRNAGSGYYFKNEKDYMLLLLRWA